MPGAPLQPNPGLPAPIIPIGGYGVPAVVLVDSAGAEVAGDTTGVSQPAGSSAISNGTTVDLGKVCAYPVAAVTLAGAATGGTVQLQGSLDGVNWYNIGASASPTTAGTTVLTAAVNAIAAARYIRVAVTAAFVGTTITAVVGGA